MCILVLKHILCLVIGETTTPHPLEPIHPVNSRGKLCEFLYFIFILFFSLFYFILFLFLYFILYFILLHTTGYGLSAAKVISSYLGTESNNPLRTGRIALQLSLLTSSQVGFI